MDDTPETVTSEVSEDSLTNGKVFNSTSACNKHSFIYSLLYFPLDEPELLYEGLKVIQSSTISSELSEAAKDEATYILASCGKPDFKEEFSRFAFNLCKELNSCFRILNLKRKLCGAVSIDFAHPQPLRTHGFHLSSRRQGKYHLPFFTRRTYSRY